MPDGFTTMQFPLSVGRRQTFRFPRAANDVGTKTIDFTDNFQLIAVER